MDDKNDWSIDDAWRDIDKAMTYEGVEDNDAVHYQDWIWFDKESMYGSNMCISSSDAYQYIGHQLQTLLDHAVVDGNKYTLTNKIVFEGKVGKQTQTPWSEAYSQFSQFAEWGFQGMPIEAYKNIHRLRTREKTLDALLKAGIKFSHIIIVEEEKETIAQ